MTRGEGREREGRGGSQGCEGCVLLAKRACTCVCGLTSVVWVHRRAFLDHLSTVSCKSSLSVTAADTRATRARSKRRTSSMTVASSICPLQTSV